MNIKNQQRLLQQITDGLKKIGRVNVACVVVSLETDEYKYDFSLADALDTLANDLYWDARGNWSEAHTATVEVILTKFSCRLRTKRRRQSEHGNLPSQVRIGYRHLPHRGE